MVSKAFTAVAFVVAGVLAGCTTTSTTTDTSKDLAEITAFNARYLKSINDGDIATLSSLTDEGHMMLSAGRQQPITGKAANDAAMTRVFEQSTIVERWNQIEIVVDRNLAYTRGTFTVDATPKAGGATRHTEGKFVRIYQRQPDRSWRMTHDVLLSDPAK